MSSRLHVGSRGITVNTVAPGLTETDLMAPLIQQSETRTNAATATALGRIGQPADIADVVAFLASHRARWITGQVLGATGGLFLRPRL
jgi:NAD(P)-dependent dehydrogenase (short-subunit alcohol dehydrogenase family)